jgi:hypothetical protein
LPKPDDGLSVPTGTTYDPTVSGTATFSDDPGLGVFHDGSLAQRIAYEMDQAVSGLKATT